MKTDGVHTIKAGWVVDGRDSGIQEDVLLEIEQGRIRRCDAPPGADNGPLDLDLSDCMLIPGLIDSHVHLFMSGTADAAVREWQLNAPYARMQAVIETHLKQQRACGVAAVRDGGDYAGHVLRFQQTRPIGNHAAVTVHTAGRAWRCAGRYGRLIGRPPGKGQHLAQAVKVNRERIDHVKIVNSGLNSLKTYGKETAPQFPLEELRAAVQVVAYQKKRVMVHVNGREPVRQSLAAGCHSIEHGFFMGADNLRRLAASQAFWVPTACTMGGYAKHAGPGSREADIARRNLDHQLEQMRQARALGVKVAVGTDAGTIGVHHGRAVREEIKLLLEAGYSIPEAVQCATQHGAMLMGLSRTGVIAPGYWATLLALPGGPQAFPANLATPVWFMIDGRTVFDHRF
ncbi:MAG: amidohydrolase family protein [Deltaproteobacteria bacterium]|nr:amidohydrolase family protein [Deltaproteobacteria bacterium]